ncbi:hypothetical protein [Actibacterium ureilyticum]|uniref:hypothetical protein n=1 Tax=Actibacterium ureilyticum TaxID=1590614 RepID=UPI000BAAB443|nr:hypothetical protein [Actibacterium ureilyticum]
MAKTLWHTLRDDTSLTVARRVPPRFDLAVSAVFPAARKGRLAHQIRQDLWRMLRHLRGFSPVVRVMEDGPYLTVTAGGQVDTRPFAKAQAEAQIADLLARPGHRARWLAHAAGDRT